MESLEEKRDRLWKEYKNSFPNNKGVYFMATYMDAWNACQKEMEEKIKILEYEYEAYRVLATGKTKRLEKKLNQYENQESYSCHTTHHLACKCREEYFKELEIKATKTENALKHLVGLAKRSGELDSDTQWGAIFRELEELIKENENV